MSSEIKTNTISEVTSGSGVTIDSVKLKDGGIDQTTKIVSSFDTFYITTTTWTTSVIYFLVEPYSNTFYTPVSGVVTDESDNSTFTFSKTGVYHINYALQVQDTDDDNSMRIRVWATTDGSTPTTSNTVIYEANHGRSDYRQVLQGNFFLNVNSTDIKIRFSNDNSSTTQNSISTTSYLESYIQFVNIGASI